MTNCNLSLTVLILWTRMWEICPNSHSNKGPGSKTRSFSLYQLLWACAIFISYMIFFCILVNVRCTVLNSIWRNHNIVETISKYEFVFQFRKGSRFKGNVLWQKKKKKPSLELTSPALKSYISLGYVRVSVICVMFYCNLPSSSGRRKSPFVISKRWHSFLQLQSTLWSW